MSEREPKFQSFSESPSPETEPEYKTAGATAEDVQLLKNKFSDNEEAIEAYEESFSRQEKGEGKFIVAKNKTGEIAGYSTLLYEQESEQVEGIKGPTIEDVRVFPEYQRQGVGSQLLQACEDEALSNGKDKVLVAVRHDNEAAINMYNANGFHEVPGSRFEPSDPNLRGSMEVQGFYLEKKLNTS